MNDLNAISALREAIENEGLIPEYHRQMLERHRAEWPTLWAAIDRVLAETVVIPFAVSPLEPAPRTST